MNKEEIYDTHIQPLMAEIIGICKANGIAMVASFSIPTESNSGLACTTVIPDGDGKNPVSHLIFAKLVRDGFAGLAIPADGKGAIVT